MRARPRRSSGRGDGTCPDGLRHDTIVGTPIGRVAVCLLSLIGSSLVVSPTAGQTIDAAPSQDAGVGNEPATALRPPVLDRPLRDLTIPAGLPFHFNLRPGGSVCFGYDVGGQDIQVTDNYFADPVRFFKPWTSVRFQGNTLVGRDDVLVWLDTGEVPLENYQWNDNQYHAARTACFVHQGRKDWEQWRQPTGFDRDSRFTHERPANAVFVRPNRYEPGRGHVVVYNWQRGDSIDVDLSTIVKPGRAYRVYHVAKLKSEPVASGVYRGARVRLPLEDIAFPRPAGHRPQADLTLTREFATFLVVSDTPQPPAKGGSFYVSPRGRPDASGSIRDPWDLQTALQHPRSVRAGDTIWLRGGTYRGEFSSALVGTQTAPIIVREYPGEEVKIDLHDPQEGRGKRLAVGGAHCWFWGFEVFCSSRSRRKTLEPGSWPDSISRGDFIVQGAHIRLINLVIHDLSQGLGFWSAGTGGEAYGLMIYNNGWTGPDRNHGHAVYTQNEGATRRFVDNVLFNQFRNGIMIYGSSAAALKDFFLEGNVSFANGGAVGQGYGASFQILIGGGSLAENITVTENYTYDLANHFRDDDVDQALKYEANLADGKPLPEWLNFAADEGYFYGTPTAEDVGTMTVRVSAVDPVGAKASDEFQITVTADLR